MLCRGKTKALKRYERRVLSAMGVYAVTLYAASWFVRHQHTQGWALYFWSVLPAIPVMVTMAAMGRYLQEETDEYLRLRTMRALLAGTAALLATLVVGDFLQAFAHAHAFPPFTCFLIFYAAVGIAQMVQTLRDRVPADE
jgi:undecaprenyl pyrophosphate phosphatase UppP